MVRVWPLRKRTFSKKNPNKNVATKLEGGGVKAILAEPLKINNFFCGFPNDQVEISLKNTTFF